MPRETRTVNGWPLGCQGPVIDSYFSWSTHDMSINNQLVEDGWEAALEKAQVWRLSWAAM